MRGKIVLTVAGLAAVAVLAAVLWPGAKQSRTPDEKEPVAEVKKPSPPPPELSESPYLNIDPAVNYVGRDVCAECHKTQHETYLLTAHSKALTDLDTSAEPEDARFYHEPSNRNYRVYRKDGEFRHQEAFLDETGKELAAIDEPMRFLIGSGAHSRSYLVDLDGFLVESPVTWYVDRERWGLSPGFDHAVHWSFERATDVGCLFCHVGNVEPQEKSLHRLNFHEKSIGCERCHGPGSLHVEHRRGEVPLDGETDFSIVHPGKLSRELGEAICAQCHLRGEATVLVRGRALTDYRPGLPLTDIRVDYRPADVRGGMKVVGHSEQMRLSTCYKQSETLTCTTCHDPHSDLNAEQKAAHYRATCLECHQPDSCGLAEDERRQKSKDDNCQQCHMPQTPTDIPHIAFTHHRIGVHLDTAGPTELESLTDLEPHGDVSHLSKIDQVRNLGLAYLEFSEKQPSQDAIRAYRARAVDLLREVGREGLQDPDVDAALARIAWQDNAPGAAELARRAAQHADTSTRARVNALFIVAEAAMNEDRIDDAIASLKKLVKLRRNSEDYFLMALGHARAERFEEAEAAILQALRINPFRPDVHEFLSQLLRQQNKTDEAERHQRTANMLKAVVEKSEQPSGDERP